MADWEFVPCRTASEGGAVWRSADKTLFKRTGDREVLAEAALQRRLAEAGFPVPEQVEIGELAGACFAGLVAQFRPLLHTRLTSAPGPADCEEPLARCGHGPPHSRSPEPG